MEPTINEKTKVVAEWDGWVETELDMSHLNIQGATYLKRGDDHTGYSALGYHTNIATLWPVAKRVRDEVEKLDFWKVSDLWVKGECSLTPADDINKANNTFDPLELFNAVYSAIILLHKYNQ